MTHSGFSFSRSRRAPVAVTGIGLICGAGGSLEAVLDALDVGSPPPASPRRLGGVSGEHPVFEAAIPSPGPGGMFTEPGLALLREACNQALLQSGRSNEELAGKRVGVCIGSSVGFATNYFPIYEAFRQDNPFVVEDMRTFRRSNHALFLQEDLSVYGPCQLVANACASGTDALGIGSSWIADGLCDMVLAGGAEALSFISYLGFIRLMITASGQAKPFDRNRSGLNLGEGAAVFVLERADTARTVLGSVLGYGCASDAYHPTAPHPEGRGLVQALSQAMLQAGIGPQDVAFVNAHGTGTRENDKVEGQVLASMFPGTPISATKGATGHTLGAAGAVEAAITLGCLRREVIPPSSGFTEPDPEIGISPVTCPTPLSGRVAISDSLAFGGCNSALVLAGGGK